jgi:hypothetical protein
MRNTCIHEGGGEDEGEGVHPEQRQVTLALTVAYWPTLTGKSRFLPASLMASFVNITSLRFVNAYVIRVGSGG